MSGSLRQAWTYFAEELWEPLANYTAGNAAAPLSLFSDLFVTADEFISPRLEPADLAEVSNDPDTARELFLSLIGTDFTSESDIVLFLEEVHNVITGYEIPAYDDFYQRLLRNLLWKFNLRYRLDDPFTLRFLLPGSFTNLYTELHRLNIGNGHLTDLLTDFEKSFDRYARSQDPSDLKGCIANVSKYVEGLAGVTCGKPGSLGDLCRDIKDWPHSAMQTALTNLYGFCSDYPGIRHAGNPAGVRRELATRDVTLASLLLLSFSGYLSPTMDEQVVLGV
jgi:hypothetical protein